MVREGILERLAFDEYATEAKCIKLWGRMKRHNRFKFKVDGNPL